MGIHDTATKGGSLPQNTGEPTPNPTPRVWQNSILVGPQTAGIPVVHDEAGDVVGSDSWMGIPTKGGDMTGGAIDYLHSQRRKR